MNEQSKPTTREATEPGPDNWARNEVRPDFGDDPESPPIDEFPEVPTWNEGQMARQRPDGSRTPGPSDEEIKSSEGGLSGGGANPGGGERWAERDVEK
jgi:hypothetical protein